MPGQAPLESHPDPAEAVGPHGRGPRPLPVEDLDATPLRLVRAAVAGSDPSRPAATAAKALGRPVVIAVPSLGPPIVEPPEGGSAEALADVARRADAAGRGRPQRPEPDQATVPILVGGEIRGLVVALGDAALGPRERSWLEAAATAAAIELLMLEDHRSDSEDSRAALLREVASGGRDSLDTVLTRSRRLGVELSRGAVAVCGQGDPAWVAHALNWASEHGWLAAELFPGRLLALVPLSAPNEELAPELLAPWREGGATAARSSAQTDPGGLSAAVAEAELLLELAARGIASSESQQQTLRLLIGVLLRNRSELVALQHSTISPLLAYDAEHDTELLATLDAFLSRHGSTSETAEALALHRHTVGYRLARVQEVSGLSPYDSDGRERLSLGLKAHQILEAQDSRAKPG